MLKQRLSTSGILTITILASLSLGAIGSPLAAAPNDIPVHIVEDWLHHVDRFLTTSVNVGPVGALGLVGVLLEIVGMATGRWFVAL